MHIEPGLLFVVFPLIFLAGFIDAIAGGGGLISLPAYTLLGIPTHMAYGTNKFSSTMGTTLSVIRFMKNKSIHFQSALVSAAGALVGSAIGARIVLALDEKYLQYCLVILLPVVAAFILSQKGFGEVNRTVDLSKSKIAFLSLLVGLIIGTYDGFFGPGTGTLLILAYTSMLGLDLTTASGNAKVVNLASNVGALTTFILGGKVLYAIAIPGAICGILGNWIGAGLAIKQGAKVIKPVFIGVLVLLFLKISLDLL